MVKTNTNIYFILFHIFTRENIHAPPLYQSPPAVAPLNMVLKV